jgi:hypothetical protein
MQAMISSKTVTVPTETLRKSIGVSANKARLWFKSRTQLKSREQFKTKGGLDDTRRGAVYVYFHSDGHALYVGQTGGGVKARIHFQTAAHEKTQWWRQWTTMRFAQLKDEIDRLVLELLLILAYKPEFNKKPGAKNLDELLPL